MSHSPPRTSIVSANWSISRTVAERPLDPSDVPGASQTGSASVRQDASEAARVTALH
jgi:hypothetical protein